MQASQAQQVYDSEKALELYTQAYAIDSKNPYTIYGLAYTLKNLQQYEKAIPLYQQLESLNYNLPKVTTELGVIYHALRINEKAKHYYSLAISKGINAVRWNMAAIKLSEQTHNRDWSLFEERFSVLNKKTFFGFPYLTKKEEAFNKTILVTYEQGLGDTIQFCRYLKILQKYAKQIILLVQEPLRDFLSYNFQEITVLSDLTKELKADYQISLLSLPSIFGDIEIHNHYLIPPPIEKDFSEHFLNEKRLKIGFVWHGGIHKDSPEAKFTHDKRNIPPSQFYFLKDSKFAFYPLQIGEKTMDELSFLSQLENHDFTSQIYNFSDSANLISNLDLIISTDTSMVHLAGALGIQTIMLNRYDGCWRWGINQERSDFYPSLTIFNQTHPGIWADPILKTHQLICALAEK